MLVRKRDESTLLGNHLSHRREKDGKQKGGDIMNLPPGENCNRERNQTETIDARTSDEAAKSGGEREIRVRLKQEREYFVRENGRSTNVQGEMRELGEEEDTS